MSDLGLEWQTVEAHGPNGEHQTFTVKALDEQAACQYVLRTCYWAKEVNPCPKT